MGEQIAAATAPCGLRRATRFFPVFPVASNSLDPADARGGDQESARSERGEELVCGPSRGGGVKIPHAGFPGREW